MFKHALHILFWEIEYTAMEVFNCVTLFCLGLSFFTTIFSKTILVASLGAKNGLHFVYLIGGIMVLFGAFGLLNIINSRVLMRKWFALGGTFMWGFLFVTFSNPPIKPTSVVFIAVLVMFSMWTFIRLVLKHRAQRLLDPRDSFKNQ